MSKSRSYQKVLVLGWHSRATLAVIRSLGRAGIYVTVGIDDDRNRSICPYSKYVKQVVSFPSVSGKRDDWVSGLKKHLETNNYNLVIPTSDDYLVPIVKFRRELERYSKFAVPDDHGFQATYYKDKTMELAKEIGVPCPKGHYVSSVEQVEEACCELIFPLVVKPVSSKVWVGNEERSLHVQYAEDITQLRSNLHDVLTFNRGALIQNFVFGKGVGQAFLMLEGRLCAVFQYIRIHEPMRGGPSSYRKSVDLDRTLLSYSQKLLRQLNWTGAAMVEYKYDENTREAFLMEINGRFWGSLPLPIAAGLDFPRLLFDMLVNNEVPPITTYSKEVYCRNTVADIFWLRDNLKANHSNRYLNTLPWTQVFKEVFNILTLKERNDTLVLDDMLPGAIEILLFLTDYSKRLIKKAVYVICKTYHRIKLLSPFFGERRFISLVLKNPSILFVCKGNICRSPMAEFYLRGLLERRGNNKLSIESAGLNKEEDRLSPETAVTTGKRFGVDLTVHRSRYVSQEMVAGHGAILLMDWEDYFRARRMFPETQNKLFLLGTFGTSIWEDIEISDPYGSSFEEFVKTYEHSVKCIDWLGEKLNNAFD